MFRVSKADVVCLAILFCVDLSVYAMLGNKHTSSTIAGSIAAIAEHEQAAMTAAASSSTVTAVGEEAATTEDADDDTFDPNYGIWEHIYGSYTVKTIHHTGDEGRFILQIIKTGELVYSESGWIFHDPEDPNPEDAVNLPKPYTDITGNGIANLVISDYSGGAHCCSTYHIFELGTEFREIDNINAAHGGLEFIDLDDDGIPEIQLPDWSYAYEFTSFAGSPAPMTVLQYRKDLDQYVFATELLVTDPPTEQEFTALVKEVQEAYAPYTNSEEVVISPSAWGGDAKLWEVMLELTYKGHLEVAMQLFEKCWHEDWPDKEEALNDFWDRVGESEYGRAVVNNQGYDLPEPEPEPDPMADFQDESGQTYHIVDIGESLSLIAKKYEVSVDALTTANDLDANKRILVGQKLVIPTN